MHIVGGQECNRMIPNSSGLAYGFMANKRSQGRSGPPQKNFSGGPLGGSKLVRSNLEGCVLRLTFYFLLFASFYPIPSLLNFGVFCSQLWLLTFLLFTAGVFNRGQPHMAYRYVGYYV